MTPVPSPDDIQRLNDRFAISDVAQIAAGSGGLSKVKIDSAAASAEIYLHGAQLTSWIPANCGEVIFLSGRAQFAEERAIRGGVPICFPWFNAKADDAKAPSHGFVRTKGWQLESIAQEGSSVAVSLSIESDDSTRKWWPNDFRAEQRITIGAKLRIELTVSNTGGSPFTFEEALHTYYRVGDVRKIRIAGLDGVAFQDNTDANRENIQRGDNLFTGRTDNAYLNTTTSLELLDPSLGRRILIAKENSRNTIVWNPWEELARGMADLGDDEWPHMVCIEAANIRTNAIALGPGERHTMAAMIRVVEG